MTADPAPWRRRSTRRPAETETASASPTPADRPAPVAPTSPARPEAAGRRLPLLSALPLVALVVAGGLLPAGVVSRQTRSQATRVCTQAGASFAALPAPTTLAVAEAGIASWLTGKYSKQLDPNAFSPLPAAVFDVETSLGDVSTALSASDGPGATHAIRQTRAGLANIDHAAKKLRLLRCSSPAFGRTYVNQLASLVTSTLALTGNFTTDANAACLRFDTKAVQLEKTLNPSSSSSIHAYLARLQGPYQALQVDLAAVRPPAGSEQRFSTFQASITRAIQELESDSSALSSGNETQLRQLGTELNTLGDTVSQEARALGLTC